MKTHHIDRNGNRTKISDLKTDHLRNIVRWMERKAEEGITIRNGGGSTPDDFWYDEYTLEGEDALNAMGYAAYAKELLSR